MFPIAAISDVMTLAEIQNNILNNDIQRGSLLHYELNYRVFRLPVPKHFKDADVLNAYFRSLEPYAQKIVTSAARYRKGELVLVVPVISQSIDPFVIGVRNSRITFELEINSREIIYAAAKDMVNPEKVMLAIESYHVRNELRAEPFSGYIEGNFFRTIRARINKSHWPDMAKDIK